MQKLFFLVVVCLISLRTLTAQGISINDNGAIPNPHAILDIDASGNDKGILIPRLSTTQRTGITGLTTSEAGLMVFDETTGSFWFWGGLSWIEIDSQGIKLKDSDQDTEVKVEEAPDEDIIRFYLEGQQKMTLQRNLHDEARLDIINTSGSVFVGEGSGVSNNTTGLNNTGFGAFALYSNITGQNNSAIGANALSFNVSGSFNTAIGEEALLQNASSRNTAIGYRALRTNTTGERNVSIGSLAMSANTTGKNSIAIGSDALAANQTGSWNVAIGDNALRQDQNASSMIAIGSNALANNTEGTQNTAVGFSALLENTAGDENTAIGHTSLLENTTGDFNTCLGAAALHDNINGNNNTAVGARCMTNNTNGNDNTAIGHRAALGNITGSANTAVGGNALEYNTAGTNNTAIGRNALLQNTVSSYNVAVGANALQSTFSGFGGNTAVGSDALTANIDGRDNVAIGSQSGSSTQQAMQCTFVGTGTYALGNYSNSTCLGNSAMISASNQVRIGNSNITSIGGQVAWTSLSDGRFKSDVQENVPGLDFILRLRPVTYHFDIHALNTFYGCAPDDPQHSTPSKIHSGFVAQEVENTAQSIGYEFSGIDHPHNETSAYGLRYAEFVTPLVKAVQEQNALILTLKSEIAELRFLVSKSQSHE